MHLVSNTPNSTVNKYVCAIIGSNSSLVISHIRGRCLLRVLCAQIWMILQGKSINSSKLCHWTEAQVQVFCKAVRRQPVWGPAVPPTRQVDYISAKKMWFTLLKRHTHTLPDTRRLLIHSQTWLDWFGRVQHSTVIVQYNKHKSAHLHLGGAWNGLYLCTVTCRTASLRAPAT